MPTSTRSIREGLYNIEKDFTKLDAAHPVGHVTMRFHDAATHIGVEKRLTFHHDSYLVDMSFAIEGVTESFDIGLGTNFGIVEWGDGFIGLIGSASQVDNKVEKETPEKELERKGAVQWVALQDKYFLSVLMPKEGAAALAKTEDPKIVSAGVRMAASGAASPVALQLYAGPKEYDTLRSLDMGLEDMIDFGWFIYGSWTIVKSVAKPIYHVLRFIHDYVGNYGVTIILLTLAIKLLFVPLQYKSYKSMKMMRVIQPKIKEVQEKYKGDRDRLNKELMKLYRDQKVNPLGGFLPMFLQMPVFICPIQCPLHVDRLAPSPVHALGDRFIDAGPLLCAAGDHGSDHVYSTEDHAHHDGSGTSEDHVGAPNRHDISVRQFSCGLGAVLADEQYPDHHPTTSHGSFSVDRQGPALGRGPAERQHERIGASQSCFPLQYDPAWS